MKKYAMVFLIAGIIGLASGMVYADTSDEPTYCEQVEQQVKERGKLNGTLACVDPVNTDLNISEEAQAELRCSCMIVNGEDIQFVNIGTA